MLDANETESLAREILNEALALWIEEGEKTNEHRELVEMPNGDIGIASDVGDDSPFGRIYSHFLPISAVLTALNDCEGYVNNFPVRYKDNDGQVRVRTFGEALAVSERDEHVRALTKLAIFSLLTNLEGRIKDALKENFEDSLVLAQASFNNNVAELFGTKVDVGIGIKEFAKDSASRRESRLRRFIEQLKSVEVTINKGGRPNKIDSIEDVFSAIRKRGRAMAGKAQIACDLKVAEGTISSLMRAARLRNWPDVISAAFATHDEDRQ